VARTGHSKPSGASLQRLNGSHSFDWKGISQFRSESFWINSLRLLVAGRSSAGPSPGPSLANVSGCGVTPPSLKVRIEAGALGPFGGDRPDKEVEDGRRSCWAEPFAFFLEAGRWIWAMGEFTCRRLYTPVNHMLIPEECKRKIRIAPKSVETTKLLRASGGQVGPGPDAAGKAFR